MSCARAELDRTCTSTKRNVQSNEYADDNERQLQCIRAALNSDVRRAMRSCVLLMLASICALSFASSHHKGRFNYIKMGDLFHLIPKDTWEEQKASKSPYYPSTYQQAGPVGHCAVAHEASRHCKDTRTFFGHLFA